MMVKRELCLSHFLSQGRVVLVGKLEKLGGGVGGENRRADQPSRTYHLWTGLKIGQPSQGSATAEYAA